MGKIERGEHMPTLAMILRIANALGRTAGELLLETESVLTEQRDARQHSRATDS
jgi:transcriptional regulator with XRE-family HTH domain